MNFKVSKENPEAIRDLLQFISEEQIANSKVSVIKTKAGEYISEYLSELDNDKRNEVKQQIQFFSFYDLDNIEYEFSNEKQLFKIIETLSKFKEELLNRLTEKTQAIDFGKLERNVSPPLEAYEYIGNNKLDIKPSGRSYGLLFE